MYSRCIANIVIDLQKYELENNPTYFSEVLRRYQNTVEFLLDLPTSDGVEGISQEDLDFFKKTYMDSSYVCRYGQCPRAWNGFRSRKDRESHETLHVKPFKCAVKTCEFYNAGFATKSALQRHDERYHTKIEEKAVPKFPQEGPRKQHQTAHEDLINAFSLSQTIPSGQAFPTRFVPIRPDEIIALPFLSDSLRQYYSDLARNCWDVIEKPGERRAHIPYFDPSTASQQLCDLTRKLRSEILVHQQSLEIEDVGTDLSKLKLEDLPAHLKKEGDDWHAVFNPQVPRALDFTLLKTLQLTSMIVDVALSHDGQSVAICTTDLAEVFDVSTGNKICSLLHTQEGQESGSGAYDVSAATFSPCGEYLATGSEDGAVRIWDLNSRQIKYVLGGYKGPIYAVVWSKEGSTIASAGPYRTICLWSPDTGLRKFKIPTEDVPVCLSVSTNGMYVAAGFYEGSAYIWECKSGLLATQYRHGGNICSVSFSSDGRIFVSGDCAGDFKIWSFDGTSKSSCLASFAGSFLGVDPRIQFTQDAAWILSNSMSARLQFWSTMSGDPQACLVEHYADGTVPLYPFHS